METLEKLLTLSELESFCKRIQTGVTIEELKEAFENALMCRESIEREISKAYTQADFKKMMTLRPGTKKDDAVNKYFESLLGEFYLSDKMISYEPFIGGFMTGVINKNAYVEALQKLVMAQSQEQIDTYVENLRIKKEETIKTFSNPETLEQFKLFIRVRGKAPLTPEQLEKYEKLVSDQLLKEWEIEEAKRAVVKAVSIETEMTIFETTHTQKGHKLFVIKLADRVDREVFNTLNNSAKKLGGYYSSYNKGGAIAGFQFTDIETAKKFIALKEEDQITDKYALRKEQQTENKINRFFEMADNLEAEGREKFNSEKLTNTDRRIRFAKSAEAEAEKMIYWAKVLRKLATKLDEDNLVYLVNISSFTQLQELKNILNLAFGRRFLADKIPYNLIDDERPKHELNINYVQYPFPRFYKEHLINICLTASKTKGLKLVSQRIHKMVLNSKEEYLRINNPYTIEVLRKMSYRLKGWEADLLKGQLMAYDRIMRMGLSSIEILKMAIRELMPSLQVDILSPEEKRAKEVRELERKFVGSKIEGFFPTPPALVDQMISLIGIEANDKILEPSAGLGHIVDQLNLSHPQNAIHCLEINYSLREALTKKGFEIVGDDFLSFTGNYDKILMNPPFEHGQDIDHVIHAFKCLNPGGRIVAIMCEGSFFRSDIKSIDFVSWLNNLNGYSEPLPEDSFKSAFRPTGVNTRIVVIDK